MTQVPVEYTNLSTAWIETVRIAYNTVKGEIMPFTLNLSGFEEDVQIRQMVDQHLLRNRNASIQTVSETIFPQSLYRFLKFDKTKLYNQYILSLPRIMAASPNNRRGTYFQRLIDFEASQKSNNKERLCVNQLDIIINALKDLNINRRTQYQASIFDPRLDHVKGPYQRFPCLGQITFYKTGENGLVLNGFYPVQHLYTKAYGNWLGLVNLGKFVAKESGLRFERLLCLAGVQSLDSTKQDVNDLLQMSPN